MLWPVAVRRHPLWPAVGFCLLVLTAALLGACRDSGVTAPDRRPSAAAPRDRPNRDGWYNCEYHEVNGQWVEMGCVYEPDPPEPPPDPDPDECDYDPASCGDPGSGGDASGPEAYIDNSGLPAGVWPHSAENEANFDCRKVRCPDPATIIQSPNVINAARELWALTRRDGVEYGAFLYRNADGTIRVGPYIRGTASSVPGMRASDYPPNAIGAIHTHPLEGDLSRPDYDIIRQTQTYGTIVTAQYLYIYDLNGDSKYQMRRP